MDLNDFAEHRRALGAFIRSQRELTNLSLRQVASLAGISNPYLSQLERGLHEPSVRVIRSIAEALNLSADVLLEQAGIARHEASDDQEVEEAIRADRRLTDQQKQALLAVYRSYCEANAHAARPGTDRPEASDGRPDADSDGSGRATPGRPRPRRRAGASGGGGKNT